MDQAIRAATTPPAAGREGGAHDAGQARPPSTPADQGADAPGTVCVLVLRLRAGEADPAAQRERLAALARSALQDWPADRRLVLEVQDGLALTGAVAPGLAFVSARRAWDERGELPVSVALHRGPLSAARDDAGDARVAGEGIATALALARADHDGVVASEAFRAALAPHCRAEAAAFRPLEDEALRGVAHVFDPALARRRALRRGFLGAAGLFALVGAGIGGRVARQRYEAAHRPAVLLLDVRPGGEVFVDGVSKGTTPPLTQLSLPPGAHAIEIRSPRAKPMHLEVLLKPGQEMEIRHVFVAPPPRRAPAQPRQKPGPFERFKFW